MKIDTKHINKPEFNIKYTHKNGNTQDIINEFLKSDRSFYDKDFCKFAKQFTPDMKGLKKLWSFVRNQIKYKEDRFQFQGLQTPLYLWHTRKGDCKSKTLFINAVLRCIGVKYKTRFTAYGTPNPTHVYTVAYLNSKPVYIDSVYNRFNKEAKYTKKIDYPMTEIAHLSGHNNNIGSANFAELAKSYQSEVNKELEEIKQKKSFIPPSEFIPFSKLTEGELQTLLAIRQAEILGAMKPEQKKEYNKFIGLAKKVLHNNGKGLHASNSLIGYVPEGMEDLAKQLQTAIKNPKPALQLRRASLATAPPQFTKVAQNTGSLEFPALDYFDQNTGQFFLAAGSQYALGLYDTIPGTSKTMIQGFLDVLGQMNSEVNTDTAGAPIVLTIPNPVFPTNPPITYNPKKLWLETSGGSVINQPYTHQSLIANAMLNFYNLDKRKEFEDRIKAESGIYDRYLNEVFANNTSIGNGFIYGYANDVVLSGQNININQYPIAVASKYTVHAQWINYCSSFTGVSVNNVKNLGTNTILTSSGGRQPTEMLGDLLKGYNPAIGIEPATISLIIGLIVAAISAASQAMSSARTKGLAIEPEAIPDNWQPIGAGLEFVANDWDTGTAPPPSGNGGAAPTKKGLSTTQILGAGAALLGSYLLLTQKSKS